jgi:hypothetical protein
MIPVIGKPSVAGHRAREGTVSTAVHVALGLVLTILLAGQAKAVAAVLRSRRVAAGRRPPRRTELVWIVIPVAVVLGLAARSWIIALDLGSPPVATGAPVTVSVPPVSLAGGGEAPRAAVHARALSAPRLQAFPQAVERLAQPLDPREDDTGGVEQGDHGGVAEALVR